MEKLLNTTQKELDFVTDLLQMRVECYQIISSVSEKTLFNEETKKLTEIQKDLYRKIEHEKTLQ